VPLTYVIVAALELRSVRALQSFVGVPVRDGGKMITAAASPVKEPTDVHG
jgi:hypothetical protein